MKTQYPVLSLALAPSSAYAWDFYSGYGFGASPSGTNQTLFTDAVQQANTSDSTSFTIGAGNFTFQVNVTDLAIPGASIDIENPSTVLSQYSLLWAGDEDLNSTVRAAEGLTEGEEPRLCVTVPMGVFSAGVTNGYSPSDEGDCSGALGKKCADALAGQGFGGAITDCRPPIIPDACRGKFPDGGLATAPLLTSSNFTGMSPFSFFYRSQAYETGSQEGINAFSQEAEGLHMVIFADQHSYYPVCLRLSDERVRKGDPAAGGAARVAGGTSWAAAGATMLVTVAFLVTPLL